MSDLAICVILAAAGLYCTTHIILMAFVVVGIWRRNDLYIQNDLHFHDSGDEVEPDDDPRTDDEDDGTDGRWRESLDPEDR